MALDAFEKQEILCLTCVLGVLRTLIAIGDSFDPFAYKKKRRGYE